VEGTRHDCITNSAKQSVNTILNQVGVSDLFDAEVASSPQNANLIFKPKFSSYNASASTIETVTSTIEPMEEAEQVLEVSSTSIPEPQASCPDSPQAANLMLDTFKSTISLDLSLNVPQ
jgi:hypothetical protein